MRDRIVTREVRGIYWAGCGKSDWTDSRAFQLYTEDGQTFVAPVKISVCWAPPTSKVHRPSHISHFNASSLNPRLTILLTLARRQLHPRFCWEEKMFYAARRLALAAQKRDIPQIFSRPVLLSRSYSLPISQPVQSSVALSRWQGLQNLFHDGLMMISTLKRRRKMMNKHKLRKRRKKNRMKTKK